MKAPARIPPLPDILAGRRVAILGAGKVGRALGALLAEAGLPPVAVTARELDHAEAAACVTGGRAMVDNAEAASLADTVLVTTADADIPEAARQAAGGVAAGTTVAHVSGALGLAPLAPLRALGALVGSMHPLQAFASADQAVHELPGSVFGITADEAALPVLESLVAAVGGIPVTIAEDARPLYHAAAVLASNYLVALEDLAAETLVAAGVDEALAARALEPLLRGTTANIRRFGTTGALTGPVVRGDIGTVRAHLAALRDGAPEALRAYRVLGERAASMALARGSIDRARYDELGALLGEEEAR